MANTNQIYATLTTGGSVATNDYAAGYAWAYTNGGKSDWYLPSKDELNELCKYARQQTTGDTSTICDSSGSFRSGFLGGYMLSSSESAANQAWGQFFTTGVQTGNGKNAGNAIRAVRAFG